MRILLAFIFFFSLVEAYRYGHYWKATTKFPKLRSVGPTGADLPLVKTVADINSLISHSIDYENKRQLVSADLIESVARAIAPEKFDVAVLGNVFDAFHSVANLPKWYQQTEEFNRVTFKFAYDRKVWSGTVDCRYAWYGPERILFTNIKIPNDCYVYSNYYKENPTAVRSIAAYMLNQVIQDDESRLVVNYKCAEGRFEVYAFSTMEPKCLTIKFEYGSYDFLEKDLDYAALRAEWKAHKEQQQQEQPQQKPQGK